MRKRLLSMLALLMTAVSGAWADDGDALGGVFTISSGADRAYFSKGNLQNGDKSYKFADNQWEVYGSSQTDGHRDLFGWGSANNPDLTSNDNNDYSTFTDWGTKIGDGTTWRTLTNDEWNYVLNTRTASTLSETENARYAYATVSGVGGLILFPDNYTHPVDVTAPTQINTSSTAFSANTYNSDDWLKMESVGAVFLPHGGCRTGNNYESNQPNYWSSTPSSAANQAYGLNLSDMSFASWWRYRGCSVRLVKSTEVTADGAVGGEFTVNASGGKVQFSKGNLQWVSSWKLADHQWDYVSQYNGDLFSWSSSGWGSQIGEGWRALSDTEWQCLLLNRKVIVGGESKASYGMGNVEGKNGLIILPDNWDGSVHSGFAYGAATWANVYSSTSSPTWAQMEAAGCVFLPAAGYYFSNKVNQKDDRGYYWSTASGKGLSFLENNFNPYSHDPTSLGASVRLVRMVDTQDDALPTDGDGATLIASKADWEMLCRSVKAGNNYSGKTVKLTENITQAVFTTLGSFAGTFDGQGHTLEINTTTAPFRGLANGGVVKNLIVNGTVTATDAYASGLVGTISGSITVENCKVNVALTSSAGYAGGIVGNCGSGNTVNMTGCVFTGSMSSTSNWSGGLVGWCNFGDNSKANTLNLTNCLFNGTFSGNGQFHPIAMRKNNTTITAELSNCYYTFGQSSNCESGRIATNKGKRVNSITAGEGVTSLTVNTGDATATYTVSGITVYAAGIKYNDVYYAGNGEEVSLSLNHSDKEGFVFNQYEVTGGGTLNDPISDTPTLTMANANAVISAVYNPLCAVALNVTGNGGTGTLMDDEFKPLSATDNMAEGEKFVLSMVKDDGYDFDVTFSKGGEAIDYLQEFSEEEYESYMAYAKANKISVPLNSVLMWVTMPDTDGEDLTMTVGFQQMKTFTVLYQPTGGSPEEVWCRLGMIENNVEQFDAAEMANDAALANGTAVWSLKVSSAFAPTKIAFFTSKEAAEADGATMSDAVVSQSSDSWTTISGGQYVLIGGNAKTIVAAFVADASNVPVFNDATVTFDAGEDGMGATYQIAVCPTDEQGNVTSAGTVTVPAAPTAPEGKQFVEWSVLEGTGQDKTEHTYHAGNTVGISENMVFSAVWKPNTVTAKLNLNGGTGAGSCSVNYSETLAIAVPTRNGFAFNGWTVNNAVSENGQLFGKDSPFDLNTPVTADLSLTAQWKHVHSYASYPISAFGSALADYMHYNGTLHVILCNCDDVQLVSHAFNSNGRCACGYEKPDASNVTFDISYVQWDNNSYIQKAKSATQNAKKNQMVSVSAPQNYSNMDFKKWQYSTDGGNSWRDLSSYLNVSFSIPCNVQLRALYVARMIVPQVDLSARTYVMQSSVNGQIYKNNNILYQMNYKLPDGYTFLDAGVRMGDNKCISYYKLEEKGASVGAKALAVGMAVTVSFLTGSYNSVDLSKKAKYYVARENSVLDEMSAETLAKYMYECKPVNVNYEPDFWQANAKTKGLSGSVNTMPSLEFTLMNGGNHWIYAIGYLRYKKPDGKTEVIYTDALPATSKNIPNYTVTKKGQQAAGARMMNRCAEVKSFRRVEDNNNSEEDLDMSLVLTPETQLTVYVDGEWSADLSDSYGYGETASVTAPEVSGKTFSHWETDGSVIISSNPLTLTMNANTTLQAVYAEQASDVKNAGFTSVTRSDDKISFQAIADAQATAAGIVYSTTATEPTIGADGVTQVEAERITDATTEMPASVLDANNCWMLQITPDDETTVYHARAYATVGGTTTYGDVKDVKLADLKSGIMMIANLEAFEQGLDVNIDEALKEVKTVADQVAVDAVIAKIAAIGEVAYTPECKALIDAARTAYDALSDEQKALVTNYDVLTTAEATYATLKEAAEQIAAAKEALGTAIAIASNINPEGLADAIAAAQAALTAEDATAVSLAQATQTLGTAIKTYFGEVLPNLGAIVTALNEETLNTAYANAQTALAKEDVTPQELVTAMQGIITAAQAVAPEHLQNLKGYAVKYGATDAATLIDDALAAIESGNVAQIIATMTAVKEAATPLAQTVLETMIDYVQAFGLTDLATQAQAAKESGNYITMITTAKALFTHLIAAAKEYLPKLGAIAEGLNDETLNTAYADAVALLAKESITPEELGAAMQNIIVAAKAVAPEHLQNLKGYAVKYGATDAATLVDNALAAIEAGNVSQIIATMTAVKEAATPLATGILTQIIGYAQSYDGFADDVTAAQAVLSGGNYITMITTAKALYDKLIAAANNYVASVKAIPTEGKVGVDELNTAIRAAEQALAAQDADFSAINTAIANLVAAVKAFEEANKGTGISTVKAAADKDVWYDMNGRKLQDKPTVKGMYLMNGRKVVVK